MTLWLADRSRYQRQQNNCQHARYREYHSGPYGYGIRAKAETVYLPTGIYLHRVVADGLQLAYDMGWKEILPEGRADFRELIQGQVKRYYNLIDARGIRDTDSAETMHIMKEQATLIEGIAWVWGEVVLPFLVEHFELESIEVEESYVVGCTCGLPVGAGELEDHETRGCEGTGWMSAADALLETKANGKIAWWETKTGAQVHKKAWVDSWEHNVQFASGILGAERRIGREVDHYYVCGFQKGSRRSVEYDSDTGKYSGPRRQDSFLCYAYHKEADPPLEEEEWRHKYNWQEVDPITGTKKNRRLSKKYHKKPIWEAEFAGKPAEMSNVEYWCAWLGREELSKLINVVGPLERPDVQLAEFVEEAAANEGEWRRKMWTVHEARMAAYQRLLLEGRYKRGQITFELVDIQREVSQAVRESFPRNWEGCRGYYGDDCEFLRLCLREAGWDDPLKNGFVHRRPHHEPERVQMEARGLPVPEEEDALDAHEE